MRKRALFLLPVLIFTGGCVAKAAFDVATAPVKVAGKAVDLATTSQSEADEARGREIRKCEERLGRLQREYDELADDCERGSDRACREAVELRREIERVLPTVPVDPED